MTLLHRYRRQTLRWATALRVAWLCLAASFLAGASPAAQAHATWIGSTPHPGETLSQAPSEVRLVFNEPVSPLRLQWLLPDGTQRPADGARLDGAVLLVPLQADPAAGHHALTWRVVSADGHPIGGTLAFSLGGTGPTTLTLPSTGSSPGLASGLWLTRWLLYVGLFFGLASWLYGASRRDTPMRSPWPRRLAATGLAVATLGLGLHGLDLLGLPLAALFTTSPWMASASSLAGLSTLLLGLALVYGMWAGRPPASAHRPLLAATVVALGVAATGLALVGHASTAPPSWLSRPALGLHVLGIAAWLGVFIPLVASRDAPPSGLLRLFSRYAPAIVAVVLVSGGVLAWRQLDHATALLTTAYGRLLLLKLMLLVALLGCACLNRRLTPAALSGISVARTRLHCLVRLEIVLALAILAVAAGWRLTPPPRTLAGQPPALASTTLELRSETASAQLKIHSAPPPGHGELTVATHTSAGQPLEAREVSVMFDQPASGIEPLSFNTALGADGLWRHDSLVLPTQDHWRVRVVVLISDFDRLELTTEWTPRNAGSRPE